MAKKFLGLVFPSGVTFQSKEVERFFGPWTTIQENGSSLLCDVISVFHSRAKQAQTERDSFLFLTEFVFRILLLDETIKVTQKIEELCTEYPFQPSSPGVSLEEGKKWLGFAISHCLCFFRGRMKP